MILYPAIDLKDGACVRLWQGDMEKVMRFNDDPAAQAMSFEAAGFPWLHVVDLDGAVAGKPVNKKAVRKILKAVACPYSWGAGFRDLDAIEGWLEAGVARVVLGTIALEQPALALEAANRFPRPSRRRDRRLAGARGDKRLDGSDRGGSTRSCAPLRGRARFGDHLYGHSARRHDAGAEP